MAAGSTYTPIATTTVSGTSTTSITFNSFSGYTDLVWVYSAGASSASDMYMRINGDTGSNYSATTLNANGTVAGSYRITGQTTMLLDNSGALYAGEFTQGNGTLLNYSNATTYKTALNRTANAARGLDAVVGLWRSTAAVTSIQFYPSTGGAYFIAGSTFTLYGIQAA